MVVFHRGFCTMGTPENQETSPVELFSCTHILPIERGRCCIASWRQNNTRRRFVKENKNRTLSYTLSGVWNVPRIFGAKTQNITRAQRGGAVTNGRLMFSGTRSNKPLLLARLYPLWVNSQAEKFDKKTRTLFRGRAIQRTYG